MKKKIVSMIVISALALPILSFADNGSAVVTVPAKAIQSTPKVPDVNVTQKVNVNMADLAALEKVKGLGEKKAQALITYRMDHGNFKTLDDLTNVPGFGPKLIKKLQPYLVV